MRFRRFATLTELSLYGCELLTDAEVLRGLVGLTSLDLGNCKNLTDVEALGSLTALASLSLNDCERLTNADVLASLTKLTSLDLSGCEVLADLEVLRGLTGLTKLKLKRCQQITDLNALRTLTRLAKLDLSLCERLADIDGLRNLTNLTKLDLGICTQLTDVEPLRELVNLTELDLSCCRRLTDVEPLRGLSNLVSLNLSVCSGLTDLRPLAGLTRLTFLDLDGCRGVRHFSPLKPLLATDLRILLLCGTRFEDLHPAVCGETMLTDSLDSVRAYYDALGPDAAPDPEINVFVLGNGRAGKTKLVGRLLGQGFDEIPEGSTHGVRNTGFRLEDASLPHPVRLNIWDFGGQDIYHGTHALFLQRAAIFVVVYSHDTENENEFLDGGVPVRNRLLPYWFDYLRAEAGTAGDAGRVVEAPVLLVQSRCDAPGDEDARPPYAPEAGFPRLSRLLRVGSKKSRGLAHFRETLTEAVADWLAEHPQPPLPKSWTDVRSEIRALQRPGGPRMLTGADFAELCRTCGCPDDAAILCEALHVMGVVFYRRGVFNDSIVVDLQWALDAIYTVFTRHEKFQKQLRRTGRFTRDDLERHFWSHHPVGDQRMFLGFMRQCGIAFVASGSESDDTAEYIAPELLEPWGSDQEQLLRWQLRTPADAGATATFALLHDGLARSFLARLGERAGDRASYWKFGCHLLDGQTGSEALIRMEGNAVRVEAWNGDAPELVRNLIGVLESATEGRGPKIEWDRPGDAAAPADPRLAEGEPERRIDFLYPRTVFVSYSHEPRSRAFVEGLVPVLRAKGWTVTWDRDGLQKGGEISGFCSQVRQVKFLHPILADNYLRKHWCLSEFFNFFEACTCDLKVFAARSTPAAEMGVIDDPHRIAAHQNHCVKEYAEYLGADLDDNANRRVRQIRRWSDELSNLLATYADELGDFGLEALAADDYRLVVEALERKYRATCAP